MKYFHAGRCDGHDKGMYEVSYCNGSCLNEPCDTCEANKGQSCALWCDEVGVTVVVVPVDVPDSPSLEDTWAPEFWLPSSLV